MVVISSNSSEGFVKRVEKIGKVWMKLFAEYKEKSIEVQFTLLLLLCFQMFDIWKFCF